VFEVEHDIIRIYKKQDLHMSFVSHSQVGQDIFAYILRGNSGTFLDIGCRDPFWHNNTASLEEIGWRGLAFDFDENETRKWAGRRRTPAICIDATQAPWATLCTSCCLGPVIDYLSLDIDGLELTVLHNLTDAGLRFRVMTIEHSRYLIGDRSRNSIREFLFGQNYELKVADVCDYVPDGSPGKQFEDWWVGA